MYIVEVEVTVLDQVHNREYRALQYLRGFRCIGSLYQSASGPLVCVLYRLVQVGQFVC